jgi:3-oxoadipate:acetyl-CoA acetyltransferase
VSVSDKLIINAAVTGTVLYKSDTAFLPTSVSEIVDCAIRVREAGASIIHLHARSPDESPSYDPQLYTELVGRVREATDLVVNVSLSGRFVPDVDTRSAPLASRPDIASLTVGSMNFITGPSVNAPDTIRELADRIHAAGAIPELEVFDTGFANFATYLARKGVLRPPYYANIILGSLGSAPLDPVSLGLIISILPPGTTWSVGGLGQFQLDANVMGIAAGGHVRVGLEDNIHFDRARADLADNPRLVARIARIAREMGREPATPAEARAIIGLPATPAEARGLVGTSST